MTVHINLPSGTDITLLPGNTEAITIHAIPPAAPEESKLRKTEGVYTVYFHEITRNTVKYSLDKADGPRVTAHSGDTLLINYPIYTQE